jgi:hypothetical protein
LKNPIQHFVIICRHSNQASYLKLTETLEKVTFYRLGDSISEDDFVRLCDPTSGKSTGVLFDDVEYDRHVKGLAKLLVSAAVRLSHHLNLHIFISLHSIFHNSEFYRLLQKNSQYYAFTCQIRERASVQNLSRQIFGGSNGTPNLLSEAFKAFCAKPRKSGKDPQFDCLILDLNPKTPAEFRIRESFDARQDIVCYQPLRKDQSTPQKTVQVKYKAGASTRQPPARASYG